MSEREPQIHSPENHAERGEDRAERNEKLKETIEKGAEAKERSPHEIEHLSHAAKEKAVSGKEKSIGDIGKESGRHSSLVIDKTVKKQAYKKTLNHVQRQLPRSQRTFSKVIHQDVIERVSEVSAKTVARPSGLLGAGLCGLVGSSIVVWMSHHYGFRYNFFVFIALVGLGFALGLVVEAILRSGKKLFKRG